MKKVLTVVLAAMLIFTFTGCSEMVTQLEKELPALLDAVEKIASSVDEMASSMEASELLSETASEISGGSGTETDTESTAEASDASPAVSKDELAEIWEQVAGCWSAVDDERFVYFTYGDEGPAFYSGYWEDPIPRGREAAVVTGAIHLGNGLYTLSLTYPPAEEAADEQDLQELRYTLALDIHKASEGIVRVEAPEDQWREYTYGGVSYDDAYDASHNIVYADFSEMQALWLEVAGDWVSDDGKLVTFDQMDSNTLLFFTGIQDAGAGRGWGTFEKAMSGIGDNPLKFVIFYPEFENEVDGYYPSTYLMVEMDITDRYTKNELVLRFNEEGEWIRYHSKEN